MSKATDSRIRDARNRGAEAARKGEAPSRWLASLPTQDEKNAFLRAYYKTIMERNESG